MFTLIYETFFTFDIYIAEDAFLSNTRLEFCVRSLLIPEICEI